MKDAATIIRALVEEHRTVALNLTSETGVMIEIVECLTHALKKGGTIFFLGNGGSAADAQHVAAEFVGRFMKERKAFPAIALTVNSSVLTAIGNDYGFEYIFARQVEALVKKEDVVVGISTSGNSKNVLAAMRAARKKGAKTIGVTGKNGKKLRSLVDMCFTVPSAETQRIQEVHILAWHIMCELVEQNLSK